MPTSNSSQSLWDFALRFYAKPQVAESCLHLQDHYRANVCILIGLHWMDDQAKFLSETDIVNLCSHVKSWTQEIVEPLREIRRRLKQPFKNYSRNETQEELRTLIKQAELLAEKELLMEIEHKLGEISANKNATQDTNLAKYMATLGIDNVAIESIQKKFS